MANKNITYNKRRSSCPIACTLDIIGDRWTALIIRDMYVFKKSRFDEFIASPENISTNILTERLKRLEENGLITKERYGTHSQRMSYSLTPSGRSLAKVINQIAKWGLKNIPETTTL